MRRGEARAEGRLPRPEAASGEVALVAGLATRSCIDPAGDDGAASAEAARTWRAIGQEGYIGNSWLRSADPDSETQGRSARASKALGYWH